MTAPRTVLLIGALAALLAGCGIRPTSYPVDAGKPPSRSDCRAAQPTPEAAGPAQSREAVDTVLPGGPVRAPAAAEGMAGSGAGTRERTLYMVCGDQLAPVSRAVRATGGDRIATADELLRQLAQPAAPGDEPLGHSTNVPTGLAVDGPAPGDPPDTLRLRRDPGKLPSWALGQIVCTFAANLVSEATDGEIRLAGPSDPSQTYSCTEDMRAGPK